MDTEKQYNILVVLDFAVRYPIPRATIRDMIYCYQKYSGHRVHYLNFAYCNRIPEHIRKTKFDLIIFNTLFLVGRWNVQRFAELIDSEEVRLLRNFDAVKIALPQDEFLHNEILCDFINEYNIDYVYSVAPESEWAQIYHKVNLEKVKFCRILTGYIDDDLIDKIHSLVSSSMERTIDIGYRSVYATWLGRHGYLKKRIADIFLVEAPKYGLAIDISTDKEDTFYGDEWYKFLLRCKYQLGVEGGSSILDRDGSIWKKTENYLSHHPNATFEEIEASCFPAEDGNLSLFALSPRNLECCTTKTCQVLIEGEYNGVLEAGKHYIELKKDFSNIKEVLEIIKNDKLRQEITERAYDDIVKSSKYSYRNFVKYIIDTSLSDTAPKDKPASSVYPQKIKPSAVHTKKNQETGQGINAILLIYDHPLQLDAPTILEHMNSFEQWSAFKVFPINTKFGFPEELYHFNFRIILMHYSLFGSHTYALNEEFKSYLANAKESYKIAFFQDEYYYCKQRFDFINRYNIDCIYTLLEPTCHKNVYLKYTKVPKLIYTLTGYVNDSLVDIGRSFTRQDEQRTIDIGYRGRHLPSFTGKEAQEKVEIAVRFKKYAADLGLKLDIETAEAARIYGDNWYRFLANCRAVLGVEAGVSIFDLEDRVFSAYADIKKQLGREPSYDELPRNLLEQWEGNIFYRTISPRHFECAALRVCQILFEGQYSGIMKPMVHYIPLKKDFSNFDEVIRLFKDKNIRQQLTENAYRDLISSGKYTYKSFIESFDNELIKNGFRPEIQDDIFASVKEKMEFLVQLQKAYFHLYCRNIQKAQDIFAELHAINPDSVRVLVGISCCHLYLRQHTSAISVLQNAEKKDTVSPEIPMHLGLIYEKLGDLYASENAFKRALTLDPKHLPSANFLALLYSRQERYDDALDILSKIAMLSKNSAALEAISKIEHTIKRSAIKKILENVDSG